MLLFELSLVDIRDSQMLCKQSWQRAECSFHLIHGMVGCLKPEKVLVL